MSDKSLVMVSSGFTARSSYLLISINALSVVLTLLTFSGSTLLETFQQRAVAKTKEPSKGKLIPWTRFQKFQLCMTTIIVSSSVAQAALLGRAVFVAGQTDPTLVSILFLTLTWAILLICLAEKEGEGGSAYIRSWTVLGVFDLAAFVLTVASPDLRRRSHVAVDLTIQILRIILIAGVIAGSIIAHSRRKLIDANTTEEETQPLLGDSTQDPVESGKLDAAKSGAAEKEDEDDDEDDDDDDDDGDNEIVDKEALEELKRRPLRQYISSFGVFIPHVTPRTHEQWISIAIILVCTVLQRAINVALPLSLGALVNRLANAHSIPWIQVSTYLTLTVLSSAGVISMFSDLASARYSSTAKMSLDRFCYDHIMMLSSEFHEAENSNRLGRLIDRGHTIADLFHLVIFKMFPQISDLFISLAVLAWLFGGYLCFIVATTIVFFAYANMVFLKKKAKLRRRWWTAMYAQWQHLFETNYNWMTVSHFNKVPHELQEFGVKTRLLYKRGLIATTFDAFAQFVRQAIVSLGFIAAAIIPISQIIYSSGNVGQFVMLVTYWNQVMSPVSGLIRLINTASEELVDAERLLVVLETKAKVSDSDDAKDIDFQGGAIDFEDVSFSYDGTRIVSEDISFHVNAGQTVAIVGETGGGKSTLLKLLFRFYDTTKGRILIDGQDIRDLKLASFRELIGFVPQDPAMFERSVADNVRYPDLKATDEEVEEACKGAVLHDKIMNFTKGYKQKVGKKGAKLSGGEQQRLAIARCIIKKPKILLLDEATSSVDSVTETKIHEGLKRLCKGRTTFIIAHRLSTILHADKILVMKNGKLVEAGPHRVLIKRDGAYKELWEAQLKLQEANPDAGDDDVPGEKTDSSKKEISTDDVLVSLGHDLGSDIGSSSCATSKSSEEREDLKSDETNKVDEDNDERDHEVDDTPRKDKS